jgi:hypothetical protein
LGIDIGTNQVQIFDLRVGAVDVTEEADVICVVGGVGEVGNAMVIAVENASEGVAEICSNDIEVCSHIAAEVDIGRQLEVFISVAGIKRDSI